MINFKDYLKQQLLEPVLSWDGSFASIRKPKPKESILSWKSSHAEARDLKKTQNEELEHLNEGKVKPPKDKDWLEDSGNQDINHIGALYDTVHDHPDIAPKAVTPAHVEAIKHYTETASTDKNGHASSGEMNSYLRNRATVGTPKHFVRHHDPAAVEKSVHKFISAFTPENTNKTPIRTYSGIPPSIGRQLAKSKPGTMHTLAGATSSSTSIETAHEFSFEHAGQEEEMEPHVMICHVAKGAGMSFAHHSAHNENEIVFRPGAHAEYRGSEADDDGDGNLTHYHHVTIHPTYKPLEEYGPYRSKE